MVSPCMALKPKLPAKSASIRTPHFFFHKRKQTSVKKRKIIQISSQEQRTGKAEKKRTSSPILKKSSKALGEKKKLKKVVKVKREHQLAHTPEMLETEPTAVIGELSYNFEEDLMRINSEID